MVLSVVFVHSFLAARGCPWRKRSTHPKHDLKRLCAPLRRERFVQNTWWPFKRCSLMMIGPTIFCQRWCEKISRGNARRGGHAAHETVRTELLARRGGVALLVRYTASNSVPPPERTLTFHKTRVVH